MSKRKRDRREDGGLEPAPSETHDPQAWDAPEFRREILITLAFVAAPALVMLAVGERAIAAAWFGVGALIVVWQIWPQIRALWHALRSGDDG